MPNVGNSDFSVNVHFRSFSESATIVKSMKTVLLLILCCPFLLHGSASSGAAAFSQTIRAVGVVTAIDSTARHITIKTDAGPELKIAFEQATKFLRVPPGASNLENLTAISASELEVGDRILARGGGADPTSFVATMILIMSKADIAKKHAAERAEWDRRGIVGMITALNPSSTEITISAPTNAGAKPIVIALLPGATLRRYSPNSVKFSDARPSRFEELHVGDQIRALGTPNEDRSRFTAEELVSGSFRTIAATVVELDAAKSTMLVSDLATNKQVRVQITADSTVRRLSAQVGQMLAARKLGAGGLPPGDRSGASSPGSQSAQQNGDLQSMIESLPRLTLADLKAGEALILSCTNTEDPSRVTAITLLAGVEPLLRASSRGGRPFDLGSWNLDLNMNVGVP
jgi:hypothetical protein